MFGVGRESYYALYWRKRGRLPEGVGRGVEDERIFWGQELEPAIARGFAKMTGWRVQKVRRYIQNPRVPGMGASADYEVVAHEDGPGFVEIKAVDRTIFLDWPESRRPELLEMEEVDGTWTWRPPRHEPPLNFQLQLQHQLACTSRAWGALAVLIGGNTLQPYRFLRHEGTINRIEEAVTEFWRRVREDDPPPVDWDVDAATVCALHSAVDAGKVVDLRDDDDANRLAREYLAGRVLEGVGGDVKLKAKAKLMMKMGDAQVALFEDLIEAKRTGAGWRLDKRRRTRR